MKTIVRELNGTQEWATIKADLEALAKNMLPFPIKDIVLEDYIDSDGLVEPLISFILAPDVDFTGLSKKDWEAVSDYKREVLAYFIRNSYVPVISKFIQPVLK